MAFTEEIKEAISLMEKYQQTAQGLTELVSIAEMWEIPQIAKYLKCSEVKARELIRSTDFMLKVPVIFDGKKYKVNNLALIKFTMGI